MLRRPIKGVQAIASDGITVVQYVERHKDDLPRNAEGLDDKGYTGIRAGDEPLQLAESLFGGEDRAEGEGPGDLPTGLHSLLHEKTGVAPLPGHQTPHVPAQQPTLAVGDQFVDSDDEDVVLTVRRVSGNVAFTESDDKAPPWDLQYVAAKAREFRERPCACRTTRRSSRMGCASPTCACSGRGEGPRPAPAPSEGPDDETPGDETPDESLRRRALQALSLMVIDPGVKKVVCGILCRADGASCLRDILDALPTDPSSGTHAASFELLQKEWTNAWYYGAKTAYDKKRRNLNPWFATHP